MIPIKLSQGELIQRGRPFSALAAPAGSSYTHLGHARNYGADRRGFAGRVAVLHTTESPNASVEGSLRYDARRSDQVSATAIVGEQGIGYDVDERARPYTQSRWNDEALSIEIIGAAAWSVDAWRTRAATLEHVAVLLADWSQRLNIPLVWLSPAQLLAGARGVCDHRTCNEAAILERPSRRGQSGYTHTDVGPGLRSLVPSVLARAAEIVTPGVPPTLPPVLPPVTTSEVDAMQLIQPFGETGQPEGLAADLAEFVVTGHLASWVPDGGLRARLVGAGTQTTPSGSSIPLRRADLARFVLAGPAPTYPAGYNGPRTFPSDFAGHIS
jgi:hypothetical protein